ncbi:hypothetical protein HANVADRAFT_93351 [Hanseniaspora valbyensis NRRL Y-1626]|uniref:Ribonucleases P/MRP subunit Pop8-like domain-containing protein n=2 Tax=Hanseniaspora valbyensis NRRL Y-1626 TaxID=766949 RepID=A0A1B7TIP0_9ASCO|nr:hypothetical protein HANVADRAFT_93351 [Hanseniaspora valbyensis NRRL Y-1626]
MISEDWIVFKLKLTTQLAEKDLVLEVDKITWKQFIQQALFKNHGVFGQGIEYELLSNKIHRFEYRTDNIAFVKVSKLDADNFINALNIYINTKLLNDTELVCIELQRTDNLENLEVENSETLWKQKLIENWED